MGSTDKAPWVKCTYRAETGIVNISCRRKEEQ